MGSKGKKRISSLAAAAEAKRQLVEFSMRTNNNERDHFETTMTAKEESKITWAASRNIHYFVHQFGGNGQVN
jgi:hypothetical protein